MIANWLFVASAVVFGVSLSLLAFAAWRLRRRAQTGRQADAVAAETVNCPNCGTTNERGYQYCQECLEALPGGLSMIPEEVGTSNRPLP